MRKIETSCKGRSEFEADERTLIRGIIADGGDGHYPLDLAFGHGAVFVQLEEVIFPAQIADAILKQGYSGPSQGDPDPILAAARRAHSAGGTNDVPSADVRTTYERSAVPVWHRTPQ